MRIEHDTVVTVEYTLTVTGGETPRDLDREFSARFVYGRDRILPALEKALAGHVPQDRIELDIQPDHAFGPYDPHLVSEVRFADLKHPERLRAGEYYEEVGHHGHPLRFFVRELRGDSAVADFNHPAAGKALTLRATVTEVRGASLADILASMNIARGSGGG